MKSVVSEKGQVTIPKSLRERLGIHPGQILEFTEQKGRLIAEKATPVDAIEAVYGILTLPKGTDTTMTQLRGRGIPDDHSG
jgi:AbrB family looped-hinge helix DNA binding protein